MKKKMLSYAVIILLLPTVLFSVLTLFSNKALPVANNTVSAEELISVVYPNESLAFLLTDEARRKYDALDDLAKDYKLECIRDPTETSADYRPYAVLLGESEEKAYVFYDPKEHNQIEYIIVNQGFYTEEQFRSVMEAGKASVTFSEYEFYDLIRRFQSGLSTRELHVPFAFACKTGVFVLTASRSDTAYCIVEKVDFFPDSVLLSDRPPSVQDTEGCCIYPILPIDKMQ